MKKKLIGILIMTLLFVSTISTARTLQNETNNVLTTDEEKLPNYLDGTVLDGSKNIIVSEDGNPPPYLDSKYYDVVISREERDEIVQNARENYIERYGIDPFAKEKNESIKSSNKFQFLKQVLNELKTNKQIKCNPKIESLTGNDGPYALRDENGDSKIYIYIVYAWGKYEVDESDKKNCLFDIEIAVSEIKGNFNVKKHAIYEFYGSNYWVTHDCSTDSEEQLDDLVEDCNYLRCDRSNVLLFGWIQTSSNSGLARNQGFASIAMRGFTWLIKKYNLAQHEISHNFGPRDHGHFTWPPCIMGYTWLFFGYNGYCSDCRSIINKQMHTKPESKAVWVQFNPVWVKYIRIDDQIITTSKIVLLDEGEYTLQVSLWPGYSFDRWDPSGCVIVGDENSQSTIMSVTGFDDPPLGFLKIWVN